MLGASPGSGVIPGQAGSPSSVVPGRLSSPSGNTPYNRPTGITVRPGGNTPGSVSPSGRDPSPGNRPGGTSGLPSGTLSPRPGARGFPGRDPSSGYFGGRTILTTIYDTSPTRNQPERSVGGINTREISVRNTSLHHRSLSAEYLLGRGADVSYVGRSRPLGASFQGRLGSGLRGHVGYTDVTNIRRSYGVGRTPFGFGLGNAGYMGNGQFIPGGYDGYIDDTGLGVDGNYGGSGLAIHGCSPAINVDPSQADGQQIQCGGQQVQTTGQQQVQYGGLQAQAGGQQSQCGGVQGQVDGQVQVSTAPTGCAIGQSATTQGTIDLNQVGQTTVISPTSEGKDTCSSTSSDSEKE